MFLVCLVLNEVFFIVCCNTPNPTNKAISTTDATTAVQLLVTTYVLSIYVLYSHIYIARMYVYKYAYS